MGLAGVVVWVAEGADIRVEEAGAAEHTPAAVAVAVILLQGVVVHVRRAGGVHPMLLRRVQRLKDRSAEVERVRQEAGEHPMLLRLVRRHKAAAVQRSIPHFIQRQQVARPFIRPRAEDIPLRRSAALRPSVIPILPPGRRAEARHTLPVRLPEALIQQWDPARARRPALGQEWARRVPAKMSVAKTLVAPDSAAGRQARRLIREVRLVQLV